MTTPKITLSASRDVPFNKLVLSQSNVRRVKAGVSIGELPPHASIHGSPAIAPGFFVWQRRSPRSPATG
jgi:hypothetical protein